MLLIDCRNMVDFKNAIYGSLLKPFFWDEETMQDPIIRLVLVEKKYWFLNEMRIEYEIHKDCVREGRENLLITTHDKEYANRTVDNLNKLLCQKN